MMQGAVNNQNASKPTRLTSIFVSIFMVVDGFSALAFGLLCFVVTALGGPPAPGDNSRIELGIVFLGIIVPLLCFGYLVMCFISLVYWLKGKRVCQYCVQGLGLIHLVGSVYLSELSQWDSFLRLLPLRFIIRELVSLRGDRLFRFASFKALCSK